MSAPLDDALHRASPVDLSLGAWRPREAALQLAAQTGVQLAPPFGDDTAHPREPSIAEASTAARQDRRNGEAATAMPNPISPDVREIDIAARGDPLVAAAFEDAARIAAALP